METFAEIKLFAYEVFKEINPLHVLKSEHLIKAESIAESIEEKLKSVKSFKEESKYSSILERLNNAKRLIESKIEPYKNAIKVEEESQKELGQFRAKREAENKKRAGIYDEAAKAKNDYLNAKTDDEKKAAEALLKQVAIKKEELHKKRIKENTAKLVKLGEGR